jgi:hypothetical protein
LESALLGQLVSDLVVVHAPINIVADVKVKYILHVVLGKLARIILRRMVRAHSYIQSHRTHVFSNRRGM